MQEKWRGEGDKLTFIVMKSGGKGEVEGEGGSLRQLGDGGEGTGEVMGEAIGDVNLFIFLREPDEPAEPAEGDTLEDPTLNTHAHHNAHTSNPRFETLTSNTSPKELSPTPPKEELVGEVELMIPHPLNQRRGFGRAAILVFLWYVLINEQEIIKEFTAYQFREREREQDGRGDGIPAQKSDVALVDEADRSVESRGKVARNRKFDYFSVKIGKENERSIRLFETLGFRKVREEANWFGEFELRLRGLGLRREGVGGMLEQLGLESVREKRFEDAAEGGEELDLRGGDRGGGDGQREMSWGMGNGRWELEGWFVKVLCLWNGDLTLAGSRCNPSPSRTSLSVLCIRDLWPSSLIECSPPISFPAKPPTPDQPLTPNY